MYQILKSIGFVTAVASLTLSASAALAASWQPQQRVDWIVVYGVGGGFDAYSRAITASMPNHMDTDVTIRVKNVTGAASINGTIQTYRARPDGHTLGAIDPTSAIPYQLSRSEDERRFDVREFVPVAIYNREPYVLWVPGDSGIDSVAALKANRIRFGITGPDSSFFPAVGAIEALGLEAGFVSGYPSLGNVVTALVRGEADAMARPLSAQKPAYDKGQVKPLLVFDDERESRIPDIPAVSEFDLSGPPPTFDIVRVIVLPPGTPDEIAAYWESVIVDTLRGQEVQAWSKKTGRMINVGGRAAAEEALDSLFNGYESYMPAAQRWMERLGQ